MLHTLADDLLQLCLSCLDAHDLSRCTAVSTRLRQLSSTDALWRPHLCIGSLAIAPFFP